MESSEEKLEERLEIEKSQINESCKNKEVIELYKNGKSTYEIEDILQINNEKVRKILIKENVPRREGSYCHLKTWKRPSDYEICELYKKGLSTIKISKKFGLDDETIRKILAKRNVSRTYRKADKLPFEKVLDMYENLGMSTYKIAKLFCVDSKTIGRLLKKNGIYPLGNNTTPAERFVDEALANSAQIQEDGYNVYQVLGSVIASGIFK